MERPENLEPTEVLLEGLPTCGFGQPNYKWQ